MLHSGTKGPSGHWYNLGLAAFMGKSTISRGFFSGLNYLGFRTTLHSGTKGPSGQWYNLGLAAFMGKSTISRKALAAYSVLFVATVVILVQCSGMDPGDKSNCHYGNLSRRRLNYCENKAESYPCCDHDTCGEDTNCYKVGGRMSWFTLSSLTFSVIMTAFVGAIVIIYVAVMLYYDGKFYTNRGLWQFIVLIIASVIVLFAICWVFLSSECCGDYGAGEDKRCMTNECDRLIQEHLAGYEGHKMRAAWFPTTLDIVKFLGYGVGGVTTFYAAGLFDGYSTRNSTYKITSLTFTDNNGPNKGETTELDEQWYRTNASDGNVFDHDGDIYVRNNLEVSDLKIKQLLKNNEIITNDMDAIKFEGMGEEGDDVYYLRSGHDALLQTKEKTREVSLYLNDLDATAKFRGSFNTEDGMYGSEKAWKLKKLLCEMEDVNVYNFLRDKRAYGDFYSMMVRVNVVNDSTMEDRVTEIIKGYYPSIQNVHGSQGGTLYKQTGGTMRNIITKTGSTNVEDVVDGFDVTVVEGTEWRELVPNGTNTTAIDTIEQGGIDATMKVGYEEHTDEKFTLFDLDSSKLLIILGSIMFSSAFLIFLGCVYRFCRAFPEGNCEGRQCRACPCLDKLFTNRCCRAFF